MLQSTAARKPNPRSMAARRLSMAASRPTTHPEAMVFLPFPLSARMKSLLAMAMLSAPLMLGAAEESTVAVGPESGPAAAAPPQKFYVEDIKQAMMDFIAHRVDENGVFRIKDEKTGEVLDLRFVEIHDPVRVIGDNTYFACTDFHVVGDEKKLYDLDFWMNPVDGTLQIYDEKIHKEPRRSLLYGWYKQPRYTFVNDRVVSLY